MKSKPDFQYENVAVNNGFDLVIGIDEVGRGSLSGPVVAGAVIIKKARMRECGNRKIKWEILGIDDSKRLSPKRRQELAKIVRKGCLAFGIGEVSASIIDRIGIVKATHKAMRIAVAKALTMLTNSIAANSPTTNSPTGNSTTLNSTGKDLYGNIPSAADKVSRSQEYVPSQKYSKRGGTGDNYMTIGNNVVKKVDVTKKLWVLVDAFNIKYLSKVSLKKQTAIIKGDQISISIAAASIIAKVYRDELMVKLSKKHRGYGWHKNMGYGTKEHQEAIARYGLTKLHRKTFLRCSSPPSFDSLRSLRISQN